MRLSKVAKSAVRPGRAAQHRWELEKMLKLVNALNPRVIIEIGSYTGWSLWAWSQVVDPGATLISVDLPGRPRSGIHYDTDPEMLERFKDHETHFIRANSKKKSTKDRVIEALDGRTADFLFIDGDHRYRGVKSDFEMYSPLVNGMVGFHDVALDGRRCRVIDFWNELKDDYVNIEFVLQAKKMMGIGVVFHRGDQ